VIRLHGGFIQRLSRRKSEKPKQEEAVACVSFQNGITGTHAIGWRVRSGFGVWVHLKSVSPPRKKVL